MPSRLVPWPRRAWAVVGVCVLIVASMGVAFHDKSHGTAFDDSIDRWLRRNGQPLWKTLIHITDPPFVVALYVVLIGWALWRRLGPVVALAVVTPIVTIESVEFVLKPIVNRSVGPASAPIVNLIFKGHVPLAYPSGHESGIGSFLAVCGLLVVTSAWTLRRKLTAIAVVVVAAFVASASLVGRYYHYVTDTIGSMFYCVAVVLVVGLVIDTVIARRVARAASPDPVADVS